ncbi:protease inhibitor I42 family protein [Legionella jordanis]|uniref:Secreted protein n=1 Tax=Legionella jordanis TaxID=456 RepID=A0A0W0V8L6_9GAMM|nr:protease inhibitor I42 family protein [Legionella jordanis]KTD16230.1 secreted protein [Legionella jordanis]RMX04550.1 hypothetical protein EAW55_03705 [Legionella jordanis]VEH12312.1 secreted protein [Legionella jordanis]HAT8713519.1 hypothetical protein [Legionella jordanis]
MKILTAVLLWAGAAICNATQSMILNVNNTQNQFVVTLPANPTTGFQWTIENYDKSFLKLLTSRYIAPNTKLIGAGGQMLFTFQLKAGASYPQSSSMLFKYARPWETNTGTMKKVTINFNNKGSVEKNN